MRRAECEHCGRPIYFDTVVKRWSDHSAARDRPWSCDKTYTPGGGQKHSPRPPLDDPVALSAWLDEP